jgi:serine/threonine-protein kinase HipA
MAVQRSGARASQVVRCVQEAATFLLDERTARSIVEHQIEVIRQEWTDACDRSRLTGAERGAFWERRVLHPYALEGF